MRARLVPRSPLSPRLAKADPEGVINAEPAPLGEAGRQLNAVPNMQKRDRFTMNPPTQPTYAAHLREACKQPVSQTHESDQLKLLDTLIRKAIEAISDNSCKLKISHALAAIKLREKVAKKSDAEQIFWQIIEDIKQEQPLKPNSETPSLEDQVRDTIVALRPQVKSGVLPIKLIADTFNHGRSEDTHFTYRRVGQLLSAMGFRKARTHTGSIAILWDDNLLFQPALNHEESEGESLTVGRANGLPCCPTVNPQKNEKQDAASPACPARPAVSGFP
jgi:hypothetical protein